MPGGIRTLTVAEAAQIWAIESSAMTLLHSTAQPKPERHFAPVCATHKPRSHLVEAYASAFVVDKGALQRPADMHAPHSVLGGNLRLARGNRSLARTNQ